VLGDSIRRGANLGEQTRGGYRLQQITFTARQHAWQHGPGGVNVPSPDFVDLGMRLTRQFKLGERASVQFSAEGFNTLNRTTFLP
jgi:hypothetical protein